MVHREGELLQIRESSFSSTVPAGFSALPEGDMKQELADWELLCSIPGQPGAGTPVLLLLSGKSQTSSR